MSPPDEPRDPDAPEPPPGDEPHTGVVEHLREEIEDAVEEVVEHVPKPVRWTLGKLLWLIALSLVGLVLLAILSTILYLANRTELVANEMTLLINQSLVRRSNLTFQLKDIKGNPLSGFRAIEPRLLFRDGDGAPLIEAAEFRAHYSLWGLLTGGRGPIDITVDHPVVRLERGPDGRYRLPTWVAGGGRPFERVLDVRLHLRDARLLAAAPVPGVSGLDLDLVATTGPTLNIDMPSLTWKDGPYGSRLKHMSGSISLAPDSVRFRVRDLLTDDLQLRGLGSWPKGGSERTVHVEVGRVRWTWLAKVFDNHALDVTGQAAAVIDAHGSKTWAGRFRTTLEWDSLKANGGARFAWTGARLQLDSLVAVTPSGTVHGGLDWSRAGWQIGGRVTDGDPSGWSALNLHGWPVGSLNGQFRYAVDTKRSGAPSSRLDANLVASELAGWKTDTATVMVNFPAVGLDSFEVRAARRGGDLFLRASVASWGWRGPYVVNRLPLEEWPDGRASGLTGLLDHGEGMVDVRDGQLFVTGALTGSRSVWSAAQMAHWRLDDVQGVLLPKPDLTAMGRLSDVMFVGVHFDSAWAPIHLGDQTIAFQPLKAAAGDSLLSLHGHAEWTGATWRMECDSTRFASHSFEWTAEPPMRISGDRQGVLFDRLIAHDGPARAEMTGRWAAPGGFYDWKGTATALDLSRLGLPDSLAFEGRADARLVVTGVSGDPRWSLEAHAGGAGMQGHRGDSLTVAVGGAPSSLDLQDLGLRLGSGWMHANGRFTGMARPWPDTLTADGVARWLEGAAHWQGRVRAENMPIDRLGRLAPAAQGWVGSVTGTLEVGGQPSAPVLDLDAHATALGWRDYRADRVDARAHYGQGRLLVPEITMTRGAVVSKASGEMPLVLAVGRNPVVPEEPMSWRVDVPRGDLELLSLFVPQIASARGRFDLSATMTGTPKHPIMNGDLHVRDGVLKPFGREETLEGVYADLRFDQSHITLDSLTARQGNAGRVKAHGVVELNGLGLKGYRFDLTMRDFAAHETGLYAVQFNGDFTVTDGPRLNGQVLPQVSGDVALQKGVIEFDFANQTAEQKISQNTQPLLWTYRIHLDAPSNLKWRPLDGEIEFSADLNLEQSVDSLIIYGEMHALRGTYYFLSNRFTVTAADLTFDNQDGVNPVLDIAAYTRLKPSQQESGGTLTLGRATSDTDTGYETIYAHITGRANQPVIDLSSDSDWDQKRILTELTYGRFVAGQSVTLGDPLDNYVTRQLNRQLSYDLSKLFNQKITEWEISRDQGGLLTGEGGLYARVGTNVTPRVAVYYKERLGGFDRPLSTGNGSASAFQRDIEAEYRINRFFFITTEVAQRRVLTGATNVAPGGTDFNVSLKARWEY